LLDRLGHVHHQLGCLARREGPFSPAMRQALPLDEAHREIALAIVQTDLVDRHDAGVVEIRRGFCFSVEPLDAALG